MKHGTRRSFESNVTIMNGQRRDLLFAQWRSRWRRFAVMGSLLVGVGELEESRLAVGSAEERDASGQVVAGESGRHGNDGRIAQKCIDRGNAAGTAVVGAEFVFDERGLVFDG